MSIEILKERAKTEFPFEARRDLGLRLRRSLSWLERAMQEEADADARFIFCWIAFNAAYGIDGAGEAGAT